MAQQTDNPLDENGYPVYGTFRQPTKQQSAVEWLFNTLAEKGYFKKLPVTEFKQAKAMEKEEIIQAHLLGLLHPIEMEATKQAEQYYNETYESNNRI